MVARARTLVSWVWERIDRKQNMERTRYSVHDLVSVRARRCYTIFNFECVSVSFCVRYVQGMPQSLP